MLNQEQRSQYNTPISSNKIEAVIKFYQTYKKELMSILLTFFCEIEPEGAFPNSFYNDIIYLVPHKDPKKKKNENCRPIFLINIYAKILRHQSMPPPLVSLSISYYHLYAKVSETNISTIGLLRSSRFLFAASISYVESLLTHET